MCAAWWMLAMVRLLHRRTLRSIECWEELTCRRLWQKLGLLVQKGNCALFNNRFPDDLDAPQFQHTL